MKIALFYQSLTVLDYAYLDAHQGVVGNSLLVDVELIGETDEDGILFDFSYAKKKIKEIIDRDCDHRLVLPQKDLMEADSDNPKVRYTFGLNDSQLYYQAPAEAYCPISQSTVTSSNIEAHLESIILPELPSNIVGVEIKLREEAFAKENTVFHYTHGLKRHYGNCQRLFHGHRNTIEVYVNGSRSHQLEKQLAQESFGGNVHFVFWENVTNKEEIIDLTKSNHPLGRYSSVPKVALSYESSQGRFEGEIPGNMAYFLHTETTVENLAIHFAKAVKKRVNSEDSVEVRAFEGIGKGARARA